MLVQYNKTVMAALAIHFQSQKLSWRRLWKMGGREKPGHDDILD